MKRNGILDNLRVLFRCWRQARRRKRHPFIDPRVPSPGMGHPADGDRL